MTTFLVVLVGMAFALPLVALGRYGWRHAEALAARGLAGPGEARQRVRMVKRGAAACLAAGAFFTLMTGTAVVQG